MTYFVFCIHNHQPAGNFDKVMEEAYEDSYWPFLKALSRHPSIKLTLHNTGYLLDWIMERHPEYIELMRSMVGSGQVEVMGGGYYEPVLSVVPETDRVRQVLMMSDKIEELFGKRPKGIWLAERVWEPSLPTFLKRAGIEYLLVDDYHFIKSGLTREELGGYYITEDQGNVIKVLPGSEELRYLIPFKPVDAFTGHMRGLKDFLKKGGAAIYGDDGEKFGVWPGTHKWVFDDGWLDGFFAEIEKNLEWIRPVNIGEFLEVTEPVGQVYLPTTSYMEMGEWSLPAGASREYTQLIEDVKGWKDGERVRRFLQGGIWRNFFSKYPEANWLHKRMLLVSRALRDKGEGLREEDYQKAERLLFKGQCNDAYWHGVFGGLYLPHLRTEVYKNLLEAENIVLEEVSDGRPEIEIADIDADCHDEVMVRTRELNLFLSPRNGGGLVELDFKPRAVNVSNTLSRWHEGYHHKLALGSHDEDVAGKSIHEFVKVKEKGLERFLKYDTARRTSFIDHFLKEDETLDAFYGREHDELGDFHNNGYDLRIRDSKVLLSRKGVAAGAPFSVTKEIRVEGRNAFNVDYFVASMGEKKLTGVNFGVELNLMMPCCDGPACLYQAVPQFSEADGIGLGSSGVAKGLKTIRLIDTHIGLIATVEVDTPATLWRHPVHTVSLSEGGFEKIYQGSCLVFLFPLDFSGDGSMGISFRIKVEGIE